MANELLLIARVFIAAIAGFMILAGFFVPWEINAIIRATILLFATGLATLISVGAMVLLLTLGGRFFRIL